MTARQAISRQITTAEFAGFIQEVQPCPAVDVAFRRFARRPYCVFFDSAMRHPQLGRYSFLAADPFQVITATDGQGHNACHEIKSALARFETPSVSGLPPFQGGIAGLFSYELGRTWEVLPRPPYDEFSLPHLVCGIYDVVLAFDHAEERAWLISQGFPETDPQARRERAQARASEFLQLLREDEEDSQWVADAHVSTITRDQLAPQFSVGPKPDLTSDFSVDGYLKAVQRAIDYVYAGDIFQVNLSQRLLYPARDANTALYLRLRKSNAATFAGYFDAGSFQIASASPERFLRVQERQVEARPIKGTRGRHRTPEADLFSGSELRASDKDRAENVMIVDLLRNDLSRVCKAESVQVTQLCELETYEYVKHLVSAITGELQDQYSALDLLAAAFPGGSITGAPKVRAMEIIAELEPTARGPYCGSLAYLGFDGSMDTSILIRTVTAAKGWWQLPVGGGIVSQSVPSREYEETWDKAAGMLKALEPGA